MATATTNKSDTIREILHRLGAVSENPPEGWHSQTVKELKKQKVQVHPTQIYNLRRRELKKSDSTDQNESVQSEGQVAAPKPQARSKGRGSNGSKSDVSLNELLEIKEFANRFGGLDALVENVQAIKRLSE